MARSFRQQRYIVLLDACSICKKKKKKKKMRMTVVVRTIMLQYSNEEVIGKKSYNTTLDIVYCLPAIYCWGATAKQTWNGGKKQFVKKNLPHTFIVVDQLEIIILDIQKNNEDRAWSTDSRTVTNRRIVFLFCCCCCWVFLLLLFF